MQGTRARRLPSRSAGAKLALLHAGRDLGPRGERIASFDDHIRLLRGSRVAPAPRRSSTRATSGRRRRRSRRSRAVGRPNGSTRSAAGSSGGLDRLRRRRHLARCRRRSGSSVTRVIAPELCALDVPHSARFLGGRRLYEAAAAARAPRHADVPRTTSTPTRIRFRDPGGLRPRSSHRSSTGRRACRSTIPPRRSTRPHGSTRISPPSGSTSCSSSPGGSGSELDRRAVEPDARPPALDRASAAGAAERPARRRDRAAALGPRRGASAGRNR